MKSIEMLIDIEGHLYRLSSYHFSMSTSMVDLSFNKLVDELRTGDEYTTMTGFKEPVKAFNTIIKSLIWCAGRYPNKTLFQFTANDSKCLSIYKRCN